MTTLIKNDPLKFITKIGVNVQIQNNKIQNI